MVSTRTKAYASSYFLVKDSKKNLLHEGFVTDHDIKSGMYGTNIKNKEVMELQPEYSDIVHIVIDKFPFGKWRTLILTELRTEMLKQDNDCNVKIENIVLGGLADASPPPIFNDMSKRSLFLNIYFQRIISQKILFDKVVPNKIIDVLNMKRKTNDWSKMAFLNNFLIESVFVDTAIDLYCEYSKNGWHHIEECDHKLLCLKLMATNKKDAGTISNEEELIKDIKVMMIKLTT